MEITRNTSTSLGLRWWYVWRFQRFGSFLRVPGSCFFLHIDMLISEINYPAPRISKYNSLRLLNLICWHFVDECSPACENYSHGYTQFYIPYERLHYGTGTSDGCQWSTASCYSLNARVSIRSTGLTLTPIKYVPGVLSLEEMFLKKKPNSSRSSRKVTRSEFRAEDTQISCAMYKI